MVMFCHEVQCTQILLSAVRFSSHQDVSKLSPIQDPNRAISALFWVTFGSLHVETSLLRIFYRQCDAHSSKKGDAGIRLESESCCLHQKIFCSLCIFFFFRKETRDAKIVFDKRAAEKIAKRRKNWERFMKMSGEKLFFQKTKRQSETEASKKASWIVCHLTPYHKGLPLLFSSKFLTFLIINVIPR